MTWNHWEKITETQGSIWSTLFDFHLFADDANLFYRHKDVKILQQNIMKSLKW